MAQSNRGLIVVDLVICYHEARDTDAKAMAPSRTSEPPAQMAKGMYVLQQLQDTLPRVEGYLLQKGWVLGKEWAKQEAIG